MTRPPCCGCSVADAAALADGAPLAVGPPDVQAVATSVVAARTAIRTRAVRCFVDMYPPLAPSAYPTVVGGRVYPGSLLRHPHVYTHRERTPFTFAAAGGAGRWQRPQAVI